MIVRYPTVTETALKDLVRSALQDGRAPLPEEVDTARVLSGAGDTVALDHFDDVAEKIQQLVAAYEQKGAGAPQSRDEVEGRASALLHQALADLHDETTTLDDPGFWRFLGLRYLWDFVVWRESATFERARSDDTAKNTHLKYLDGRNPTECVLTRMYLRACIAGADENYRRAHSVSNGTDFWRSHILRVQTGTAPGLARAFVDMQSDQPLTTDPLRDLARRVNRMWSNVVLHQYDHATATELLTELREQVEGAS